VVSPDGGGTVTVVNGLMAAISFTWEAGSWWRETVAIPAPAIAPRVRNERRLICMAL
jgi:hypothetical protein